MAARLAGARQLQCTRRPCAAEILRPRDVSLPVRQIACRTCAQLHDGRSRRPLSPRPGQQRLASDGMGRVRAAGRERGDCRQHASRGVDKRNIRTMRAQLQRMGFSYDWSREIATCHPEYYRHEQKMFLDFLAADLAYRKESWVNWDPE